MSEETLFEQKVTVQDQRAGTSTPVEELETEPTETTEETESSENQLDLFDDIFDGELVEEEEGETQDVPADDEAEPLPEGELIDDEQAAVEPAQTKAEPRNYDDFDESERPLLKQMSNAAFEKYAKNKRELSEARAQLDELNKQDSGVKMPENMHEHPEAYTLSHEYREAATNYAKAQSEFNHWKQQLINVRNGEAWQGIEGYDQSGRMVASKQAYQPTQSSEIDIESALQEAKNFMNQFGQQAAHIQQNYGDIYKNANTMLADEQKKYFEWEGDPEKLNTSIETPTGKPATIGQIKEGFFEAIPSNFKRHPVTNLASNLYVTLQLQSAELGKLKKQLDISETNKKDSRRVEPRSARKSEPVGDDEMFSTTDFEKLLG